MIGADEPPVRRLRCGSARRGPSRGRAGGRDDRRPSSPFGLSFEYPLMERALGAGPCPTPAFVASLKSLGSPTVRIGGDSQDLAGPTTAYHYFIAPSFWTTLGCLARESGSPIVVGLNFAESPVADEQTTIAEAEQAIPAPQLSFSLGNEPDLYGLSHILPNEPGFTVPAYRAPPWTAEEFASEWTSRRAQLGADTDRGPRPGRDRLARNHDSRAGAQPAGGADSSRLPDCGLRHGRRPHHRGPPTHQARECGLG